MENSLLRSIPKEEVSPRYAVMHRHSCAELFVCFEGTLPLFTETQEITLTAAQAALVPPMLTHCASPQGGRWGSALFLCARWDIHDTEDLYGAVAPLLQGDTVRVWNLSGEQTACAARLLHPDTTDRSGALLLTELLVCMHSEGGAGMTAQGEESRRRAKLEHLINTRFTDPITLQDVADCLFVSRRQASRIVRAYYGAPLRQVITDNRLSLAEQLLRSTDMSLLEISTSVGFGAVPTFRDAFLRKYGVSPRTYREQIYSQ